MRRRRGSVLILVMFVMTVLSLVALSFAYRVSLQSRGVRQRAVMQQLRAQASSAVAIAAARLAENTNEFDHFAEPWHTHAPLAREEWLADWSDVLQTGGPVFDTDYQVIDEEGKLNVLQASAEALEALGMTDEQIDSLFDWMDADDIARGRGAETSDYQRAGLAYRCKNAPLEMLEELLLIRGFTPLDFLGEDANHNRLLDPCENDGGRMVLAPWGEGPNYRLAVGGGRCPPDNGDGKLQLGWIDLLTCFGDGRINLNTAPREVLETLPLSSGAVGQIVGFRAFDEDSSGELVDHVFKSPADIDQLQGLTETDKEVLHSVCAFKSQHFRIFVQSKHVSSGLAYHLQVVIRMGQQNPEIIQWKPGI